MAVILTLMLSVREGWNSNLEPAKSYTGYDSGAGTIFGQGGQDRERQIWEREMKVISGIGERVFVPETGVLQKKGLRQIWSVNLSEYMRKKCLCRIWSVFLSQKWLRIQVSGGKSRLGGAKIFPGRGSCPPCPPTSRTYGLQTVRYRSNIYESSSVALVFCRGNGPSKTP